MLRLIPLVSRRWQCIRSSYLAQPSVGRRLDRCCRLEPLAGGYPDVANTRLFDDCNIRGRRSLIPTQKATFSEVYKTHGKLKEQFQRTMRTYKLEGGKRVPSTVYELIKACTSGLMMEDPTTKVATANELFTQLKMQGAPLDTSLFNILLKVYLTNDHQMSPSEFLEDMTGSGVQPNQGTFNLLIEAYCNQGNLAGATNLIEHMKALNLPISETVYANLITAHSRSGDIVGAEGMLRVMKENGHVPSIYSYTSLLCAFAENGNRDGIESVYEEMQKRHMFPGVTTYIKVIDSLSKFNHPELIPEVLKLIRNKQWLIVDLRDLTCALMMRGEMEGSFRLFECLKEIGGLSTFLGQCFVRGMIKNRSDLRSVLAVISDFNDDRNNDHVRVAWLYKELLYLIYGNKLSTGNQRAEDIVTVIKTMQKAQVEVRTHYIYPALAHYSNEGNVQGAVECILITNGLTQASFNFLEMTLKKANMSIVDYCQAHPETERIIMILIKHFIAHQQWNSAAQLAGAQNLTVSVGDILKCIHQTLSRQRPLRILEVFELYKVLSGLETCPQLVKSIELITKSLALQSRHDDALTWLCKLENVESLELPKRVYEVLLHGFESASQADQFYKILEMLEKIGVDLSLGIQKEILKMAAILRSESLAARSMKLLEDHDTCTSVDMSNYIQAIAQDNFSTALLAYKRMRLSGHTPTYLSMEQLISASLMQNLEISEELLSDATSFGYTLRLGVKNDFIEQYSKRGDVKSATAMVDRIISDSQTPTHKTYQRLMEGYAYRGDAEQIRNLIKRHHLTVDRFMLSHLVTAYLNSNCYKEAMKVLDDYPGVAPLLRTLIQLTRASLKDGYYPEHIERVKLAMDQLDFTRSSQSEIVFNLCFEAGQLEGVWQEIQKDGFVLHDGKFLALCRKLINSGQKERVGEVLLLLQKSGYHKTDKDRAASILAGYDLIGDAASANNLIQELREMGYKTNADVDPVQSR